MKKLPWKTSEYTKLEPGDLSPEPPTPERRIRVVAALATRLRDARMLGEPDAGPNFESIRSLLAADDATWAENVSNDFLHHYIADGYDTVSPELRMQQTMNFYRS